MKKLYSVSLKNIYINKNDRTSHQVGHSDLNKLDTNDLFKRKQMIEDMEAELTETSEINSKTDNLAVTEEANVHEAITAEAKVSNKTEIDLKKERNTQEYEKQ